MHGRLRRAGRIGRTGLRGRQNILVRQVKEGRQDRQDTHSGVGGNILVIQATDSLNGETRKVDRNDGINM